MSDTESPERVTTPSTRDHVQHERTKDEHIDEAMDAIMAMALDMWPDPGNICVSLETNFPRPRAAPA